MNRRKKSNNHFKQLNLPQTPQKTKQMDKKKMLEFHNQGQMHDGLDFNYNLQSYACKLEQWTGGCHGCP